MNGNSPIRIVIEGKPESATANQSIWKNGDKRFIHKGYKATAYQQLVTIRAREAMKGKPPLLGAIRMDVIIHRHVPKAWSKLKTKEALAGFRLPITTPDRDNALKLLQDGLNGIVYKDDGQVVEGDTRKRYANHDYVEIEITELGFSES